MNLTIDHLGKLYNGKVWGLRDFSLNAEDGVLRLIAAELRVMLQGQAWWWYLVAAGLIVRGVLAPVQQGRALLLPLGWLWPLALWQLRLA